MADENGVRSGLGCLWMIGWTFVSAYAYGFAAFGFESDGYPEADATTWTFAPAELVLLSIWLVFWLGGITVWHTVRWLRQSRHDGSSTSAGMTGFAKSWAIFLCSLAISIVTSVRPFEAPYQSTHRWLWFLDTPALVVLITGALGVLWTIGIVGVVVIRTWLWRIIDVRQVHNSP